MVTTVTTADVSGLYDKESITKEVENSANDSKNGALITFEISQKILSLEDVNGVWENWRGYLVLRGKNESLEKFSILATKNLEKYFLIAKKKKAPQKSSMLSTSFASLKVFISIFELTPESKVVLKTQQNHYLTMHQSHKSVNGFGEDFVVLLSFNGLKLDYDENKDTWIISRADSDFRQND